MWKVTAHPQYAYHYEVLHRNDDGKAIAGITTPAEGELTIAIFMGAALGYYATPALAKKAIEEVQVTQLTH